jgi:hypothetical protein
VSVQDATSDSIKGTYCLPTRPWPAETCPRCLRVFVKRVGILKCLVVDGGRKYLIDCCKCRMCEVENCANGNKLFRSRRVGNN